MEVSLRLCSSQMEKCGASQSWRCLGPEALRTLGVRGEGHCILLGGDTKHGPGPHITQSHCKPSSTTPQLLTLELQFINLYTGRNWTV